MATQKENFSSWYTNIVIKAGLADYGDIFFFTYFLFFSRKLIWDFCFLGVATFNFKFLGLNDFEDLSFGVFLAFDKFIALNFMTLYESDSEMFFDDRVVKATGWWLTLDEPLLVLSLSCFWMNVKLPRFGWPEFGPTNERFSFLFPNMVLNDFELVVRTYCFAESSR